MIRKLLFLLAFVSSPVLAGSRPLVIIGGASKQLPAATSLQLSAPTTANASLNLPHGTAPSAPADGDCWTTSAGLYCRINGSTVGPYGSGGGGGGSGTVTSVAALTLGTSGTDLGSSVANSTTTPVITLNVPTASATNRGALSSTDWSTFNGKQDALVSGTSIKTVNSTSLLGSGNLAVGTVTSVGGTGTVNGLTLTGTVTGSGNLTLGGTLAVDTADINNGAITLAKMANLAANSILGNNTGSAATPIALTTAQTKSLLAIANTDVSGLGTMSTQAAGSVAITGGAIDGTPIGDTTPAAAEFTTLGWTGVKYTAAGSALGSTIADYFTSSISLDAGSVYEIEAVAYFLKTTAGTVTWTWAFSSAPTMSSAYYTATPITGFTTSTITGAPVTGEAHRQAGTTMAHAASGSLTTAVYHTFRFKVLIMTNAATTIQLRCTESAGTVTPQAGSFMRATKVL